MLNFYLYKKFNPDLKNLNNHQLLLHWNNIGKKENRINSLETFFNIYPYYDHNEYKLYNKDIEINDKIELMKHWHINGKNNRICSYEYFHLLYSHIDIDKLNHDKVDIIDFHNYYHKINVHDANYDKFNIIKKYLNPNKEIIGLYIYEDENMNENFFIKSLSYINYHDMNIILISKNMNHYPFLNDIYYYIIDDLYENNMNDNDRISSLSICNYIITNSLNAIHINAKKIFLLNHYNDLYFDSLYNISFVDNIFDNFYFNHKILITEYEKYILINNSIKKINDISIENNYDKIYVNYNIIDMNHTNYTYDVKDTDNTDHTDDVKDTDNTDHTDDVKDTDHTDDVKDNDNIDDMKDINHTDHIDDLTHTNYNLGNSIKTYIINLDDRKDRLRESFEECQKIKLDNIERFSAIKMNKEYKLINRLKAWKKNDIKYLLNASSCKISHLEVLKKSLLNTEEYILILEDDIVFEDNLLTYLNLALIQLENIDWDIFFLSSNLKNKEDAIKIDNNVLKLKRCSTTTAQLFKRANIEKIIKIIEHSDIEIDNTYDIFIENKYCLYPMCAYQRSSYSNINNINIDYGNFHKKYIY